MAKIDTIAFNATLPDGRTTTCRVAVRNDKSLNPQLEAVLDYEPKGVVDAETGKIDPALLPEALLIGIRQGTDAERLAADPALEQNEPFLVTDSEPKQLYVGTTRVGAGAAIEVDKNSDKLALTSIPVGQRVRVKGEANRLEEYQGYLGPYIGMKITVSGFPAGNGEYTCHLIDSETGSPSFKASDNVHFIYYSGSGYWIIYDENTLENAATADAGNEDYPWEATWPDGTVTYNPIADDHNWEIIGLGTALLSVGNQAGSLLTSVNGVDTPDGEETTVGWVKLGAPIFYTSGGSEMSVNTLYSFDDHSTGGNSGGVYSNGWDSMIIPNIAPRARSVFIKIKLDMI